MQLRALSTKENVSIYLFFIYLFISNNLILCFISSTLIVVCVVYYFVTGLKCKLHIDSIKTYCLCFENKSGDWVGLVNIFFLHFFQDSFDSNKRVLYSLISIKYKGSDEAVLKSYTKFITLAASHLNIDISDL